ALCWLLFDACMSCSGSAYCISYSCVFCFFFFSSRRRHTRFSRDWSSDVCSSDLCWAIRYGRDTGLFRRQEVADFAPWLAASKGSPFGHLPGPLRARHLLECFDNPEPLLISHERKSLLVR